MTSPRPTVLVVDDDDALRETLCDLLGDEGYRTLAARGGIQALDLLRGSTDGARPAVILLDLMMPGMSGWQFRDVQLADPAISAIPVIVMTATRNLDANPIDANEVLLKPLKLEHLLDTVRRLSAGA